VAASDPAFRSKVAALRPGRFGDHTAEITGESIADKPLASKNSIHSGQ
jgi:hypothetical protein